MCSVTLRQTLEMITVITDYETLEMIRVISALKAENAVVHSWSLSFQPNSMETLDPDPSGS